MLIRLLIFFLLILVLPTYFIYRKYISKMSNRVVKLLFWLPTLLIIIVMAYILISYEPSPRSIRVLANFIIFFLCYTVPQILFTLMILFMMLFHKITGLKINGEYIGGAIAIIALGYIIYGGTYGKRDFQVREVTTTFRKLPPEFNGYKIVQISDLHSGSWTDKGKALSKVVRIVNKQNPDLIVFTGDLVNNLAYEVTPFMKILSGLKAKYGVYSVLGNHDYSPYVKWNSEKAKKENMDELKSYEAQMGWRLLNNENVKLRKGNDSIALIGVENSGRPPFPDYGNLPKALKGTDKMFKVLLSHDPTHWRREVLPKSDVNLMLSGHTHNMQTSIFGFSPAKFVYDEYDGLYSQGDRKLFVNIGLGYVMFPLRIGARPEITVITLSDGKGKR